MWDCCCISPPYCYIIITTWYKYFTTVIIGMEEQLVGSTGCYLWINLCSICKLHYSKWSLNGVMITGFDDYSALTHFHSPTLNYPLIFFSCDKELIYICLDYCLINKMFVWKVFKIHWLLTFQKILSLYFFKGTFSWMVPWHKKAFHMWRFFFKLTAHFGNI